MNKWIGMGRLTKDPDVRAGETTVARYTLAVDRRFAKGDDKTDFINCVCFGKAAEFAEKYLKKGTKILVSGRIQTGSYEKDGKKVYTTDIIVEDQEFAESKSNAESSAPQREDDFMDMSNVDTSDMPF